MKKATMILLMMVSTAAAVWADHIPVFEDRPFDYRARLALLIDAGDFDPVVELEGAYDESEFLSSSLTVGSYYRLHRNLKIGAFYRLQLGVRDDDDWIDTPTGWTWEDTLDRPEHIFILDVTPRAQLDFLPGENWVVSLKNRYLFNTYNAYQTLQVRPGVTYFWMRDRAPVLNVSANYELYLALNFSDVLLYEHWPYLNVLYHLSPTVKLEASIARRTITWTTGEVSAAMGDSYEVTDKTFVLGFGVLYRMGL